VLAIAIPYLPGADWFGFVPLPAPIMAGLIAITLAYLAASEATKRWFFTLERRHAKRRRQHTSSGF
jgi:Mg2+-importing ATPase